MSWLQLACVCVCVSGLRAAVAHLPDGGYLESFNVADDSQEPHARGAGAVRAAGVRALDVREWGAQEPLRLRDATGDETQRFQELVQPIIDVLESRGGARGRRPESPPRPQSADDDTRTLRDIRTMVNKFIVSELAAPDANQPALPGETDPTLAVYLWGAHGALVLRAARREWQFVLRAPSPLPAWLLAPAAARGPLPPQVQTEFYHTLLRLLKIFLRFDL